MIGKEKVMRRMKRQICRVDLTLQQFEGTVKKGVYSFPFKIDLPASLPASTKFPPGQSTSKGFRIEYKIVAGIHKVLQEELPFHILSAPLSGEPVQYMFQPAALELKAAGMIGKGRVSVGASIINSHVGRGEKLNLHLACRNDSTAEIQRVEIKLLEELEWGKSGRETITHLHHRDVSLPGLDKQRVSRSELINQRADPTSASACYQEIFQDLVSGENCIPLSIPFGARDSYKGQIVQISHFLEIKLKTVKIVTNPVIRIPIRIGTAAEQPPLTEIQEQSLSTILASDSIPIVSAVSLPADTVYAPMTIADPTIMVLGGRTVVHEESEDSIERLADLEPIPPPACQGNQTEGVSLDTLLFEMAQSINDYDILTAKLDMAAWRNLFAGMSPDEYGSVILRVSDEFDQPRVAALLAPYLNQGTFTCQYAAAAVRCSVPWNRACVAQRLLPMCRDVASGQDLIQKELSEWDRTVTEEDFQKAIAEARNR